MERSAGAGWVATMVAAAAVLACDQKPRAEDVPAAQAAAPTAESVAARASTAPRESIPKLIDLGAGKCIPCKAMAPILEKLRVDYAGRLDVEFIDVWKNAGAAEQYRIRTIPTQIFYAADGRELGRHEGFIDREGILDGFEQLGVQIKE